MDASYTVGVNLSEMLLQQMPKIRNLTARIASMQISPLVYRNLIDQTFAQNAKVHHSSTASSTLTLSAPLSIKLPSNHMNQYTHRTPHCFLTPSNPQPTLTSSIPNTAAPAEKQEPTSSNPRIVLPNSQFDMTKYRIYLSRILDGMLFFSTHGAVMLYI